MPHAVFIVEDDITMSSSLAAQFSSAGIRPRVHNGQGEIKEILDRLKTTKADFLVLDLGLPGIDSYELLKSIRADDDLASLPIFVYTGDESRAAKDRCAELGTGYFYTKTRVPIPEFIARSLKVMENIENKS